MAEGFPVPISPEGALIFIGSKILGRKKRDRRPLTDQELLTGRESVSALISRRSQRRRGALDTSREQRRLRSLETEIARRGLDAERQPEPLFELIEAGAPILASTSARDIIDLGAKRAEKAAAQARDELSAAKKKLFDRAERLKAMAAKQIERFGRLGKVGGQAFLWAIIFQGVERLISALFGGEDIADELSELEKEAKQLAKDAEDLARTRKARDLRTAGIPTEGVFGLEEVAEIPVQPPAIDPLLVPSPTIPQPTALGRAIAIAQSPLGRAAIGGVGLLPGILGSRQSAPRINLAFASPFQQLEDSGLSLSLGPDTFADPLNFAQLAAQEQTENCYTVCRKAGKRRKKTGKSRKVCLTPQQLGGKISSAVRKATSKA